MLIIALGLLHTLCLGQRVFPDSLVQDLKKKMDDCRSQEIRYCNAQKRHQCKEFRATHKELRYYKRFFKAMNKFYAADIRDFDKLDPWLRQQFSVDIYLTGVKFIVYRAKYQQVDAMIYSCLPSNKICKVIVYVNSPPCFCCNTKGSDDYSRSDGYSHEFGVDFHDVLKLGIRIPLLSQWACDAPQFFGWFNEVAKN